ncbi:hypothetical protein [Nocardioides jensenii]|uniref:hypothetical protein n=1 Tax=Nocardioides jensenii TaxID=1843 RepID=UPI000831EA1D|nr:hypothetical protein [Nocardioides jensenii]
MTTTLTTRDVLNRLPVRDLRVTAVDGRVVVGTVNGDDNASYFITSADARSHATYISRVFNGAPGKAAWVADIVLLLVAAVDADEQNGLLPPVSVFAAAKEQH